MELFLARKFRGHRLFGFFYLVQFAMQFYLLATDRKPELRRILNVTLGVSGFLQAIIACMTFTFLPKTYGQTQGYFSDRRTMSYDFIQENMFFSGMLAFQALYYTFPQYVPMPIELILVFFPYYSVRQLVAKTSFRGSYSSPKEMTERNRFFMRANLIAVKFFYVFAKWFQGFFCNYLIFLGALKAGAANEYLIQWMLLLGGWGTTIAMFLHTLKFKKYIGPRTGMLMYTGSFPFFIGCYIALTMLTLQYTNVLIMVMGGVMLNFIPYTSIKVCWQFVCFLYLLALREGTGSAWMKHIIGYRDNIMQGVNNPSL